MLKLETMPDNKESFKMPTDSDLREQKKRYPKGLESSESFRKILDSNPNMQELFGKENLKPMHFRIEKENNLEWPVISIDKLEDFRLLENRIPLKGGTKRKDVFFVIPLENNGGLVFKTAEPKKTVENEYINSKTNFDEGLPVSEPIAILEVKNTGNQETGYARYLIEEKGIPYKFHVEKKLSRFLNDEHKAEIIKVGLRKKITEFVEPWIKTEKFPMELGYRDLSEHLLIVQRNGKEMLVMTDADVIKNENDDYRKNKLGKLGNDQGYFGYLVKSIQSPESESSNYLSILRHDLKGIITAPMSYLQIFESLKPGKNSHGIVESFYNVKNEIHQSIEREKEIMKLYCEELAKEQIIQDSEGYYNNLNSKFDEFDKMITNLNVEKSLSDKTELKSVSNLALSINRLLDL